MQKQERTYSYMSIRFDEKEKLFSLDTDKTTYKFRIAEDPYIKMEASLMYSILAGMYVITQATKINSNGADTVYLKKVFSGGLDFNTDDLEMLAFYRC